MTRNGCHLRSIPHPLLKSVPLATMVLLLLWGCTPRLQVDPITINMNLKIEHEVRVKVEKDLDTLFEDESELF